MGKYDKTLSALFADPVRANILWADVVALLKARGAIVESIGGSMVAVKLAGHRAVFHRPHPEKETYRALVRRVRQFLIDCNVRP